MREARGWRARPAVAVLAVAAGCWAAVEVGGRMLAPMPMFAGRIEENFSNGEIEVGERVSSVGFEPCPDGLCLRPRVRGVFHYRVAVPPAAHALRIRMWGQLPNPGGNVLSVSADGGRSFTTVFRDVQHTGKVWLDVPFAFDPAVPAILRVEANNGEANMAMPLDKIEVLFLTAPTVRMPPGLSVALMCAAFVGAAAARSRAPLKTLVTGAIVVLAIVLRYEQFAPALERPLDPDAQGYATFARQLRLFSGTGFYSGAFEKREPLWILSVHAWFSLVGPSAAHLKLLTLTLSAAGVWAMTRLATSLFGAAAGWLGGLMFAVSAPLAFESSRGLRLELELLLLIGFLFATFVWRKERGLELRWVLVAGTLAGLLALTRSAYVSSTVPLLMMGAFYRRGCPPMRKWIAAAAGAAILALVLVAPHRYALYARYGDPFWDTASYARAIANTEFAGTPGFPTRDQIAINGDMGPPLTYRQYLFTLHTPKEVARGTASGFVELFRNMDVCRDDTDSRLCTLSNSTLQLFALAGFLLAVGRRAFAWIPVAFVLLEVPVAFLYDRNILEVHRHILQGFPLAILGALVALDSVTAPFRARRRQADACPV